MAKVKIWPVVPVGIRKFGSVSMAIARHAGNKTPFVSLNLPIIFVFNRHNNLLKPLQPQASSVLNHS